VGRDRPADLLHVTVVGTATAAKNVDVSKGRTKIPVLSPEFIGIAIIELYRFIEFRVAQARRIGAKTSDARGPLLLGDFDVRQKIVAQTLATITVFQQDEGGEIG
jgi:hypothetical protein